MPRSRSAWGLIAAAILAVAGGVPSPAIGSVQDEYQRLAERGLQPAPLVPTTVPAELSPIDSVLETLSSRRRSGYGFRLSREGANPAVIALEGGAYASMRAARTDLVRRQSFRPRPTRIRGHVGLLLTRRGPTSYVLVWREGGRVYAVGTGTARTVSVRALRRFATGLDPLQGSWIGSGSDPNLENGALLVTTRRTVSATISWSATCRTAAGEESTQRAGSVDLSLLRRSGARFAFDLAGRDTGTLAWSGQGGGVIGPDSIALTLRATGTFDGDTCDTGPVELRLTRSRRE